MTENDKKILQEIVDVKGSCLQAKRCTACPFRKRCLPDFLEQFPPSRELRFRLAFEALTNSALLDDHDIQEQVESPQWDQK